MRRRGRLPLVLLLLTTIAAPAAHAAAPQTHQQTLVAPDSAGGANFGRSVAIDGGSLVVGAPYADGSRGAAYVYEREGGKWTNTAKLTPPTERFLFGSSVAIDGDTIVVGSPVFGYGPDPYSSGSGSTLAYTFARAGAYGRAPTGELATTGAVEGGFGAAVAIDGGTIAVGVPADGEQEQGAVYAFDRSGPQVRYETAKLTASDASGGQALGQSVAIDSGIIVAGAPGAGGSVYAFGVAGPPSRTETAKFKVADPGTFGLGWSVAIDGDTIVAGAPFNQDGGKTYTFAGSSIGAGSHTAELYASGGNRNGGLGFSVAIDGPSIVAGSPYDTVGSTRPPSPYDPGGGLQGALLVFARSGASSRSEEAQLVASSAADYDHLGESVAVSGETIVGGSPGEFGRSGSVRVFATSADAKPPKTGRVKGKGSIKRGKRVRFRFSSPERGATFGCRLDDRRAKPCSSPYAVNTRKLRTGRHTLRVRAVDAAGNTDPTPSKKKFKVLKPRSG